MRTFNQKKQKPIQRTKLPIGRSFHSSMRCIQKKYTGRPLIISLPNKR